ncbi:hypothetical protein [Spirillospora sp. NPDC048819]|uniref:alpha/beta fold hydrolase n=1 Tax=Spirillospora sp. NPDC048819 TaxID=3155268 RepID=UPI0033CD4CE4
MARIVLGVGASHSTLMNTHWDEVEHVDRAERFRDALGEARNAVRAWEAASGRPHRAVPDNSGATDAKLLRARGMPTARVGMPKVVPDHGAADFALGMNTVAVTAMRRLCEVLARVRVANALGDVPEAQAMHEAIPGSQLELFDDTGHWPQHEQAARYNPLSLGFLAEVSGRRAPRGSAPTG